MRAVTVEERRARMASRHRLAPEHHAADVIDATRSVVCLHATDPATVFLSAWARVDDFQVADLESALYDDRSLIKHLAMRRTLFVFPRELMSAAQSGASDRVARTEADRLRREVEKEGLHADSETWLADCERRVLAALADGREATSAELREEIPLLGGSTTYGVGRSWGGQVSVGPRVLTVLSARGRVVRASNRGGWTSSRPRWAAMTGWLGGELVQLPTREGVATMVERWLRAFGPGTATDLKWWLGSTVSAVRTALADLQAVEVDLDGSPGYLLEDDLEPVGPVAPWAALLPGLDPTTMGWYERGWYLGPYKAQVFDTNGNAGPTAWWDGRIVGGWRQDEHGAVEVQLLEDIGLEGKAALDREASRLSSWLGDTRVLLRFPTPLSRGGSAG